MVNNRKFNNLKFRRQHSIGNYVVDFYCAERKLIIEVDGDSHYTNETAPLDEQRSNYLNNLGYQIVRYTNDEIITNLDGVFEDLTNKLNNPHPTSP